MVFHGSLELFTLALAFATGALALFTYLSVRAIRQQTSMAYWLGQLQNLYTPLHEEFLRYEEDLDTTWELGEGGLGQGSEHNPWQDALEPLMSQHGHLATDKLYEVYEEIVRLGPFPKGDDVKMRVQLLLSFKGKAETDFRTIRRNLRKAARRGKS